jgi:hypothetical protein
MIRGHRSILMHVSSAAVAVLLLAAAAARSSADVTPAAGDAFVVKQTAVVPCTPLEAFDAFTGDITPWWDHSFSATPYRMYIEPKPGGGFVELFDAAGNGALHATVITVRRGKLIRFDGPLGLAGSAVLNITTCTFDSAGGDSCRVTVEAHMSGEVDQQLASIVDGVWRHFLVERFAPYIRSGAFRSKKPLKP